MEKRFEQKENGTGKKRHALKTGFGVILLLAAFVAFSCVERPLENTVSASGGYKEITAAGVTFKWKVAGTTLDCIMSAACDGWVAVGFVAGGTQQKSGANIIIGYVDSGGTTHISDDYADSGVSHVTDSHQDVTVISGTNTGGVTEIHFAIPLNSGDPQDIALTAGSTYYIMAAYNLTQDDFTTYHDDRGYGQITL